LTLTYGPAFAQGSTAPALSKTSVPRGTAPAGAGTVNEPAPGTTSSGTAAAAGSPRTDSAMQTTGAATSGPNGGNTVLKKEQDSDAKIDAENRKLDRTVSSICKGC
jgi:hypothetical protein